MRPLSFGVARPLRQWVVARTRPACLVMDTKFLLRDAWGGLSWYGLDGLVVGEDCREALPFLWGLAGGGEIEFPFLAMSNGRHAHVRVTGDETEYRVFFLDASEEHDRRQPTQQLANEVRLLNERQTHLLRQLRRTRDELAAANAAKSRFIAGMSHEFRTPLSSIIGHSQLLLEQVDEPRRLGLEAILRGGRNLLALVENLLDHGALEAGRLAVQEQDVSLSALLEDLETLFAPLAQEKGLALGLGAVGEVPAEVRTDGLRLRQILVNLLANGIKFTASGRVGLSLAWAAGWLSVQVADTGPGIPRQQQESIFSAFERGAAASGSGTGLGLAISAELARRLGGELVLLGSAPTGSEFQLRLPAKETQLQTQIRPTPHSAVVLLVEDNDDSAELMMVYLHELGMQPVCFPDPAQALGWLAQGGQPDLVISDLNMPGLDGEAFLARLRHEGLHMPCVVLSASANEGDRQRVLAAGADEFLLKPLPLEQLSGILSRYLEPEHAHQ